MHKTVKNIYLSNDGLIIENIDVLLISWATDTVDSSTISKVSRFLENGKRRFIAQGGVSTDIQTQQANPINSNIFSLLKTYGLIVNQNLVLDKSCGRVQVQQQMGFIRMNVPMEYPFLPIIRNFYEEELEVSGSDQILIFFHSEVKLDTLLGENVFGVTDLLSSSNKSGIMSDRFMLVPDPKTHPFLQNFIHNGKVLSTDFRLRNAGEVIFSLFY